MKPREQRRRVVLPARMRSHSGWSDACILNISSRGLLVYSNAATQPGTFVEIRRGCQLVVARVVWRKNQRMGLYSTDPVHIEDVISSETAASAVQSAAQQLRVDRRTVPRIADQSRSHGRAMEFMAVVLAGTALAGAAAVSLEEALGVPLSTVRTTLESR